MKTKKSKTLNLWTRLKKLFFWSKPERIRNYRREYDTYHGKPEQKKLRAQRNRLKRIKSGT